MAHVYSSVALRHWERPQRAGRRAVSKTCALNGETCTSGWFVSNVIVERRVRHGWSRRARLCEQETLSGEKRREARGEKTPSTDPNSVGETWGQEKDGVTAYRIASGGSPQQIQRNGGSSVHLRERQGGGVLNGVSAKRQA